MSGYNTVGEMLDSSMLDDIQVEVISRINMVLIHHEIGNHSVNLSLTDTELDDMIELLEEAREKLNSY